MKRLAAILSSVLDSDEYEVHDELSPEAVENWDSLHGLILVTEIENEFDVQFTMTDVTSVTCVKDIKDILQHYGVEIGD